jgi:hypothetical protein
MVGRQLDVAFIECSKAKRALTFSQTVAATNRRAGCGGA